MKVDYTNVNLDKLDNYKQKALDAFDTLMDGSGEGADFLGWIDRPVDYDKEEFDRIKKQQKKSNPIAMFWFQSASADHILELRL